MFDSRFPVAFGSPPATAAGTTPVARLSGAGAPTDGVTGIGLLNKGDEYMNSTNGQRYTNVGTSAATVFQMIDQLAL